MLSKGWCKSMFGNYKSCLRVKINYQTAFRFKYHVPKKIKSGVVYKIQCGLCNKQYYGECIRHLNIRIGEYITIFS